MATQGTNIGDPAGEKSRPTPRHKHIDTASPEGTRNAGRDYAEKVAAELDARREKGSPVRPAGDALPRPGADEAAGGDGSPSETLSSEEKAELARERTA
jgi:hypothetical protein